eukprot:2787922-Ditylum_brightwellii.AAC.1
MTFIKALPPSRLGKSHPSLQSYLDAVYPDLVLDKKHDTTKRDDDDAVLRPPVRPKQKEFSLVVVTESRYKRILLGMKNRGFGKGFYNAFGGKIDPGDKSPAYGAMRELKEETNINVPLDVIQR